MTQSGIARVLTLFIALVGGMIAGKMLFSRCSPASASSAAGSMHSRPHYVTPKDTETDAPPSKVAPHRVVAVARTPGEPISFREKEAYKVVKGMCAQNADLFPGVLDTSGAEVKWVPESCKLPSLKDLEAEACFSYVNQVWVGDTNLHSLAMALGRRAGSMTTASEKRKHFSDEQRGTGFPKDSFNYFFDFIEPTKASPMAPQFDNGRLYFGWAPSSRKPQTLNYTFSKEAIRSADYVVMSNGLDDMSSMFTPVMEYFHIMRKTVEAVKRSMKPGSRVLLIPVHYFNLQKAKKGSEFALCNSGTKAEAYRQALSLVASCTGSAMLDSYDIMKEAAHFTTDGVHYTDNMMAIQANIVAAYICGGMALPSDPAACATEETVASALLKLSTVYEVNIRCREEDTDVLAESSAAGVVEVRTTAPDTQSPVHEGKPVKSIRTPSLEPEAAFTTVSGMCNETKDLFPGRIEKPGNKIRWMPEKCKLPTVAELEGRKCMAEKYQVWFGDSNLYRLAMAMGRRAGKGTEESIDRKYFDPEQKGDFPKRPYNFYLEMIDPTSGKYPKQSFDNGRMYYAWSPGARRPAAFEYDMTQAAIPSADYVVINSGMWDMGGLYIPIVDYFHTMRKRVEMVQKMMKPGARLLLIPVHYLNIHKCPRGEKCELCNSPQKASAYRTAFSLVASCTGAALLRSFDIMKEAENYTHDGIHYTDKVVGMQADIVASYMCGGMKLPSDPSLCQTTGDIEKTLRKLAAIPEANVGCREA